MWISVGILSGINASPPSQGGLAAAGAGKEPRQAKSSKIPEFPAKDPLLPGKGSGITGAGAAGMGWEQPWEPFPQRGIRYLRDQLFLLRDSCFSQRFSPRDGFGSSPCRGFPGETLWEFTPLGKTWIQHGNKRRNCCGGMVGAHDQKGLFQPKPFQNSMVFPPIPGILGQE